MTVLREIYFVNPISFNEERWISVVIENVITNDAGVDFNMTDVDPEFAGKDFSIFVPFSNIKSIVSYEVGDD